MFENLSFTLNDGEFAFITGPSGSGKTTLIRLIMRDLLPDSGEIIFDGENIVSLPLKEIPLIRQKMGVVFQDFKVLRDSTVRENVEIALAVIGVDQSEWKDRVEHVLNLVELGGKEDMFPSELSGGELQRVSMARALVVNPKIILADEPTGNLDWETSKKIMDLFEKIEKEGKTIMMATHNRLIVESMKKRIIKLGGDKNRTT